MAFGRQDWCHYVELETEEENGHNMQLGIKKKKTYVNILKSLFKIQCDARL